MNDEERLRIEKMSRKDSNYVDLPSKPPTKWHRKGTYGFGSLEFEVKGYSSSIKISFTSPSQ